MSYFFEFKTIKEGYPKLIQTLFKEGEMILDKTRGSKEEMFTKDLHNVMITILEPGFEQIPSSFIYGKGFMKEYGKQLLNPTNETGFNYTYGTRLRSYPFENVHLSKFFKPDNLYPTDQISYVIKSLRENKQTRRAITTTLFPPLDNFQEDIPCLQLTDFKNVNGTLHLTTYFRSHDILALPTNLYGLNGLLNYVSKEVNLRPGTITIVDSSLHAYQRDWKYLLSLIFDKTRLKYDEYYRELFNSYYNTLTYYTKFWDNVEVRP